MSYITLSSQINVNFSCDSAVFSGWETANKYAVKNVYGQQMYFAAEGWSYIVVLLDS